MSNQEFSNEFDILYNNAMSNAAPGLDEYEKSVFLSKAQDEILKNAFNAKGNKYQEGLDDSAKRQLTFSHLIQSKQLATYVDPGYVRMDERSSLFIFPEDMLLPLSEILYSTKNGLQRQLVIIPLHYEEYNRLMSKPSKRPCKNTAWRIVSVTQSGSRIIELVTGINEAITAYKMRYIKKYRPIILVDLTIDYPGCSINGSFTESTSEVDPSIHQEILQRAVEIAKSTYIGDLNSTLTLGQRNE